MSQSKTSHKPLSYRLTPGSSWANAWKVSAIIFAAGVAGAIVAVMQDHQRFAFSYLFAFIAFLTIALGGVFFGLLQYVSNAAWSVSIRRTTEFLHWPMALFALLFVPVLLSMDQLYPWTSHGDHGAEHATGAEAASPDHAAAHGGEHEGDTHALPEVEGVNPEAEHAAHAATLASKAPYLNRNFFYLRTLLYFIAWILISRRLFQNSTRQDESGDPAFTVSSQRGAPLSLILFAFTTTFASFDWLMSLEPSWFSTIFGVNFFAQCLVSMFAVTILIALSLRAQGHLHNAVNVEHFHDLGKLQLGFLIFWAYVNFSQYMLIWYASLPEETTYYHLRWSQGGAGWKAWSLAIVFGHFVLPFFVMLSRNAKRALTPLGVGAALVLLFHFVMIYWLVMPYYGRGLSPSWVDVACLAAVGGAYFTAVFYSMSQHPIIPVRDPRLPRSLDFVNA